MNFGLNDFAYHSLDEVAYDESELESLPVLGGQTLEIGDTAYAPVRILERGPGGDYQGTGADGEDQEIEGLLLRDGYELCGLQVPRLDKQKLLFILQSMNR